MGLLDLVKNLFSQAGELNQGSISDALGGVMDNPIAQEAQDRLASISEHLPEPLAPLAEQGQELIGGLADNQADLEQNN